MAAQENNKTPDFKAGDTVRVHVRVVEGNSERVQVFEGVVLRRRGAGDSETFTVRKVSFGVGVERVFPLNSPRIAKVEVMRVGRVRRSRIYYLRKLFGKKARLAEDRSGETLRPQEAPQQKETPAASDAAPAEGDSPAKAEAAPV